jgi:hypothetical protein
VPRRLDPLTLPCKGSWLGTFLLANGKHRVLGSIAYVGACRANHLFVADPDDPTGRRVLMLENGANVARKAGFDRDAQWSWQLPVSASAQ